MKNLLAAEAAMNFVEAGEVKEELSRFAKWLEDLFPRLFDFIFQVALAFVVIIVGVKLIGWIRKVVKRTLEKRDADVGLVQFLDSLIKILLYILLALSVMQKFGLETATVVAAIGSVKVCE